ncbi:MAG: acetylxylan esterase [Bacteroidetes bacterium]|nr:acetylxylan esterase [Bacteroidota bacterium]
MGKIYLLSLLFMVSNGMAQQTFIPNYEESKVVHYTLPALGDVLGKQITSVPQWEDAREKWLQLFATKMYGIFPSGKIGVTTDLVLQKPMLDGKAEMKIWEITLAGKVKVQLIGFLPVGTPVRAALIGLNFCGNITVYNDAMIPLSSKYVICNENPFFSNHKATVQAAGVQKDSWQIEKLMNAGFASFSVSCADFEEDFPEGYKTGIRTLLSDDLGVKPQEWSAISAWAWGLSRMADVMKTWPILRDAKIILHGHSRMGKASLWAAANDPRFDAVIAIQSGEGGAALLRRNYGEGIEPITTRFPHWFLPSFSSFAGKENTLPFDQHILLSLIAPRPLFVSSAQEDKWADPKGEFLSAKAASNAYTLYGKKGITEDNMPETENRIGNYVNYYIRKGKHEVTSLDWDYFLPFISRVVSDNF